ncbi:MAG: chromosomal replication initiator protein DnaA [Ruminococcaceae bacterium]|nr:chromosomal replication initiator protein DnaA [Oscillospiraceae bacterium]
MSNLNSGDLAAIWQITIKSMVDEELISQTACDLWFKECRLDSLDSETAVFAVENEMKRNIIADRYSDMLASQICKVIGYTPAIVIKTDLSMAPDLVRLAGALYPTDIVRQREEAGRDAGVDAAAALEDENTDMSALFREAYPGISHDPAEGAEKAPAEEVSSERRLTYNEDYTFDNFVVGNSNQLAHAAALSVADNVGMKINPLFIYGPSGLGKTHLMYAIANRALKRDPNMKVIYVKGEEFMNQLIEAIRVKSNAAFREKYRRADMLLIDDIQFIAGKESTQMEFFHTFDALYEDHKQIIITSDRPPKELTTLEERIRSRFEAGLITDIQPPDYELRLAILKNKAQDNHMDVPMDVIEFLANNLQSNIRQIEGVIKKLGARNLLSGLPISMDMVITTLPEYLRDSEPVGDTVTRILEIVARRYKTTTQDILGSSRKKEIKTARNVAMYAVRVITKMSLPQIGTVFSRDHSTVHSNITMVESSLTTDPLFEATVTEIIKEVKRAGN